MRLAVIVSTYNNPTALRKCLLGFAAQDTTDFELLVADDGSDGRTRDLLSDAAFRGLPITHVWHEDRGFRLAAIRNLAVRQTSADYLLFCDGDCVPRRDLISQHRRLARRGSFLSGARVEIPAHVHEQFSDADILQGRVFDVAFLAGLDPQLARRRWRLAPRGWWTPGMDWLTWRYCVFCGSNGAVWRADLVRVNGFDQSFTGYGSEDRDLGIRLRHAGVRPRYRKFSLCELHLGHPRPYLDPQRAAENRQLFRRRWREGTTRIEDGLDAPSDARPRTAAPAVE